jgi:cytoskeletal protein CcmA (bactofilin family)
MFRRRTRKPIDATRLSSLIGAGVEIAGDVAITDGLRIDGRVEGHINCSGDTQGLLVLSETGSIVGGAKVYDAVINGTIRGDLEVVNYLELQASARVTGNIRYRQMQMDCGATVDGKLERLVDGIVAQPVAAGNVVPLPRSPAFAAGDHEGVG